MKTYVLLSQGPKKKTSPPNKKKRKSLFEISSEESSSAPPSGSPGVSDSKKMHFEEVTDSIRELNVDGCTGVVLPCCSSMPNDVLSPDNVNGENSVVTDNNEVPLPRSSYVKNPIFFDLVQIAILI